MAPTNTPLYSCLFLSSLATPLADAFVVAPKLPVWQHGWRASASVDLDHVVYVVEDLQQAMDEVAGRTGVAPVVGGRHTGLGTHNAFLGLGNGRYLELFAPDPEAEVPLKNIIGVDGPKPRVSTYCCSPKGETLQSLLSRLQLQQEKDDEDGPSLGYFPTEIEHGSRVNDVDGSTVSWSVAVDRHSVASGELPMGGLLPFFIDWGDCQDSRPAVTVAPPGCSLLGLEAYHPDPEKLRRLLEKAGVGSDVITQVHAAETAKLVAKIQTPNKGVVELS